MSRLATRNRAAPFFVSKKNSIGRTSESSARQFTAGASELTTYPRSRRMAASEDAFPEFQPAGAWLVWGGRRDIRFAGVRRLYQKG